MIGEEDLQKFSESRVMRTIAIGHGSDEEEFETTRFGGQPKPSLGACASKSGSTDGAALRSVESFAGSKNRRVEILSRRIVQAGLAQRKVLFHLPRTVRLNLLSQEDWMPDSAIVLGDSLEKTDLRRSKWNCCQSGRSIGTFFPSARRTSFCSAVDLIH
ncbi:hypothetical protein AVEN_13463-1 [Araneus ventricosus]|uniref:Uncharacterized protein n=1 Tax=Araneus ventricosus TaxID=182803 RepID=A0A4Y2IXX0_ARAVE|nr:hypothetical protein AVEN_13463-1 [Araneus ventricosus]